LSRALRARRALLAHLSRRSLPRLRLMLRPLGAHALL